MHGRFPNLSHEVSFHRSAMANNKRKRHKTLRTGCEFGRAAAAC